MVFNLELPDTLKLQKLVANVKSFPLNNQIKEEFISSLYTPKGLIYKTSENYTTCAISSKNNFFAQFSTNFEKLFLDRPAYYYFQ